MAKSFVEEREYGDDGDSNGDSKGVRVEISAEVIGSLALRSNDEVKADGRNTADWNEPENAMELSVVWILPDSIVLEKISCNDKEEGDSERLDGTG